MASTAARRLLKRFCQRIIINILPAYTSVADEDPYLSDVLPTKFGIELNDDEDGSEDILLWISTRICSEEDEYIEYKLDVWLRDCNPRCNTISATHDDKSFFIIGEAEALALDSFGKQHYLLRNVDRFKRATSDCGVLSNLMVLGSY
ncbi:hypothetical protein KIN20_026927 [Parelaphostrongylus tenuis]|uniref:Uncharacterized protein n=1 Tax=Parelaphostrongylus tenuis TaxID=148309 RepID=A0AAD5QYN2_PARTN|nr:hypothetical protein KIN20_026927 [Parelaphostrongylus tenuis]